MSKIVDLLFSEYNIVAKSIVPAKGGFSAKAYCAKAADGTEYFVKEYDKSLPTTRFFVERIDIYMPVLAWLEKTQTLHGRILTPVATKNGNYKAETERSVYALFLFVRGTLPGIAAITRAQTVELAEILAGLHEAGENIPFETQGLEEDITLPFCEHLLRFLDNPGKQKAPLWALISPHADLLRSAIKQVLRLRDTARRGYAPLVLCHGDAHGNNVIQSERLVLADWEDLRRAPAEADLFIYAWHPQGDALLEAYAAARNGYSINRDLLYFYVLRRRIEDIWLDIQRLTEESPDKAETATLMEYIRQGIEAVQLV